MKFKNIHIENFRNYKDITIELSNRNIFLGLNDVGKSNLLQAIRLVLDRDVRKNNCIESDFYQKNIENPIRITLSIDISDFEDSDTEKIRARMRGISLSDEETLYIQLTANYLVEEQEAIPEMRWGGDIDDLYDVKGNNPYSEIDKIFNVIFIDSSIDFNKVFARNIKKLIQTKVDDDELLNEIDKTISELNNEISKISGVKTFEEQISEKISKFRDHDLKVTVKSEIAVKGLFDNIVPYIQKNDDDNLYPTAGDGRRKLLAYSILEMLSETTKDSKINIFLVEEPENHLHKSLQISLSDILFSQKGFPYFFITTHSPFILSAMGNVQLIRIYNNGSLMGGSSFYPVPDEYQRFKCILNNQLTDALFANKVLLVEGPSEKMLFDYVAHNLMPDFEAKGGFILQVEGLKFRKYYNLLNKLGIKVMIKTDNDLRSNGTGDYSVLSFCRCNGYINKKLLPETPIKENSVNSRRELYDNNYVILKNLQKDYSIYLSRCDLENDLDEVMHEELVEYLGEKPVEFLQESKCYHMLELIQKLTLDDCKKIYSHKNFNCLKEII